MGVEHNIGKLGQRRTGFAGHADDGDIKALQERHEGEQLCRFTGVGHGDAGIAVLHDAEVAMQGVHGIKHHGGSTGGGESGGNLIADEAALTHAHNDNLVAGVDGLAHGFHCFIEGIIELIANDLERINFVLEYLFTANDMTDHDSS